MMRIHHILAVGAGLSISIAGGCSTQHFTEPIARAPKNPDPDQTITFSATDDSGQSESITLIYTQAQLEADPQLLLRTEQIVQDQANPLARYPSVIERTIQVLHQRLSPGSLSWYPQSSDSPAAHPAYIGRLGNDGYSRHAVMIDGWDRVVIHSGPLRMQNDTGRAIPEHLQDWLNETYPEVIPAPE